MASRPPQDTHPDSPPRDDDDAPSDVERDTAGEPGGTAGTGGTVQDQDQ